MRRALAMVAATSLLAGCTVTQTTKPPHVAIWGPSAPVERYAASIRAHDPTLDVQVSRIAGGASRIDLDLVRGGAVETYPALRGGAGLTISYTSSMQTTTVKLLTPLGLLFPDPGAG